MSFFFGLLLVSWLCYHNQFLGLGWFYIFQPGSGFGPCFLSRFSSGKKCFDSGLPKVKIIFILVQSLRGEKDNLPR